MAEPRCPKGPFRARYDKNPKSLLGRMWRWHINWCPGWKSYISSLSENERTNLIAKYKLKD